MPASRKRFIELGVAPPLATEIAAQINNGSGDIRRLRELGMPSRASYLMANAVQAGTVSRRELVEAGVVPAIVGEFSAQLASMTGLYIESVKRVGGSTSNNYVSDSPASGGSIVNRTYGQTYALERKGTEVQVVIFNADISSGALIHGLSIYPTNTEANSIPTGPEVQLTFNGAAPSVANPVYIPAGTPGPSGAVDDRLHSWIRSDWVPITMVDRVDGGPGSLLHLRIFSSGGLPRVLTNSGFTTTYDTAWSAPTNGRTFKTWYATGDLTHTPAWSGGATTTLQSTHPDVSIKTRGTVPILNLGHGFNSQPQGFASGPTAGTSSGATGFYNALLSAQKSRVSGPLFSAANLGSAGQQGSSGHLLLRTWIDALQLRAAFIQVWSGNDGYAGIEAAKARTLQTVAYALARGCVPILVGCYPRSDSTTSGSNDEAQLIALNAWIAAQGLDYVVTYDALGNGATPQRLQADYSADGIHRSMAGQDVEGAVFLTKAQEVATRLGIS